MSNPLVRLVLLTIVLGESAALCAAASLSHSQTLAIVEAVQRQVQAHYVVPEKRPQMIKQLASSLQRGRYSVGDPNKLATLVTEDLEAASGDKHMRLFYDPDAFREAETASIGATASPEDSRTAEAAAQARAKLFNYGVPEMRILNGNVRYVRISSFNLDLDTTGLAIDAAMRFINDGDAAILDIRSAPGGTNYGVQYWVSHFFDQPRELMAIYDSLVGTVEHSYVLAHLPAGRYLNKPLAVLINGSTGSAAEAFAYHIKQFKLGTLVGRRTVGAGHTVTHLPVAPGFVHVISTGRPVHPVSKGNWEGTGVEPDVNITAAKALDAAHLLLLEKLKANPASESAHRRLAWALPIVRATLKPFAINVEDLASYAGSYGSERSIRVNNGLLQYERRGGDPIELRPLDRDLFELLTDRSALVRFVRREQRIVGIEMSYETGQPIIFDKTS